MEIVNIRIDERLIHGQVAAYWTASLKATRILVIDDYAAKDQIQKMALKMATPKGVKLSILTVPTAAENLRIGKYEGDRVFMIARNPETLVQVWDAGYHFDVVNVGNMSSKYGSVQVRRTVGVTKDDVKAFRTLTANGVKLTAQMIPSDDVVDFAPLVANDDIFEADK